MKKDIELKLYVYEGFQPNYTGGIAFAIAASEEKAKKLIAKKFGRPPKDWGKLTILAIQPVAFCIAGGA